MSSLRFEWDPRKATANKSKHGVSLVVCHCHRSDGNVIRIISARKATTREAGAYQP